MVDGEGSVDFYRRPGKSWRRRVRITNTSPGIVRAVSEACECLGVHYTLHARAGTKKPAWEFNFPGCEMPKLAELLELGDERKADSLRRSASYAVVRKRDTSTGRWLSAEVMGA
jgi:hypothetical protein